MKRREFIQCAIGAAFAALPWHQASVEEGYVRLLPAAKGDLAGEESESGFAQALERLSQAHPRTSRTVIVPSASAVEGTGFSISGRRSSAGSNRVDRSGGRFCCLIRSCADTHRPPPSFWRRGHESGYVPYRRLCSFSMATSGTDPALHSNQLHQARQKQSYCPLGFQPCSRSSGNRFGRRCDTWVRLRLTLISRRRTGRADLLEAGSSRWVKQRVVPGC